MRRTTIIIAALLVAGCQAAEDLCWTDIDRGYSKLWLLRDSGNFTNDRVSAIKQEMRVSIRRCASIVSDSYVKSTPAGDMYYTLLDYAIIADDAEMTGKRLPIDGQARGARESAEHFSDGLDLHVAAYFGSANALGVLLDHGIDPTLPTERGMIALHDATGQIDSGLESIRALVDRGADINHRAEKEITPIMMARQGGDLRMAQCLAALGAALPTPEQLADLGMAPGRRMPAASVDEFLFAEQRQIPADVAAICAPQN